MVNRICRVCGVEKPLTDFPRDVRKSLGHTYRCKTCGNAYHAQWRAKNPDKRDRYYVQRNERRRGRIGRDAQLRQNFGITIEDYERMLQQQGGVCIICQDPERTRNKSLAVDHDRRCCPGRKSCGKCLRGLLCQPCNQALGMFFDDVEVLERAIAYLMNSRLNARSILGAEAGGMSSYYG